MRVWAGAVVVAGLVTLGSRSNEASAAGCSDACSPGSEVHLLGDTFDALVETWAEEPVGQPTEALEALLFYGREASGMLDRPSVHSLDAPHREFLVAELARDRVVVEFRLVDDEGAVRGAVPPTELSLVAKHHLSFQGTGSLDHFEASGKVKRVGLGHLWSRW